jgi:D-3-phosphoglycerate dehydrogenase
MATPTPQATAHPILVLDNVDARAIDLLSATPGFAVTAGAYGRAETLASIAPYEALIIRSATTADAELIAAASNLKLIARAGVGVDNVDLRAASARGIVVVNTPDGNTISTAEHTFGLLLALARHIPQGHASLAAKKWDRKALTGFELKGKTLGIVGFGRIGRAVAKRALAFEMSVLVADPFTDSASAHGAGVELVSLDQLYQRADIVTLHCLVTDDTKGMINRGSLAKMKRGVRIVNAARGALINEADLAAAIKAGHVAGAALDVYAAEPPPADHPLIGLPQVIHTPHVAASTSDAQVTVAVDAARLVIAALTKQRYDNVCNPEALGPSAAPAA